MRKPARAPPASTSGGRGTVTAAPTVQSPKTRQATQTSSKSKTSKASLQAKMSSEVLAIIFLKSEKSVDGKE